MDKTTLIPRPMVLDEFVPLVGRTFEVDCEPRTVSLMLLDASASRHPGLDDRPPFTLTFHSEPDKMLLAGTYIMRCGSFGPDLIHISPVTARPGAPAGYQYQAVFN